MLVGIAGRMGAGKNYVADLLEHRGWRTLDLDVVAHRGLEVLAESIRDVFGTTDRRELGRLVFSDPEKLKELEGMTYPWIEAETRLWIAEKPHAPSAIHAVNLHRITLKDECDAIIWVKAPFWLRRRRVMNRDGLSWRDLKDRFRQQKGLNPKLFSPGAEIYSVRNSGNHMFLEAALARILNHLEVGMDLGG